MSGTYTIAPSGGHYTSIAAAVSALGTAGMSGAVVLELSASYAGESYPISLASIGTASSTNTITIRPASGVVSALTMAGGSTSVFDIAGNYYKIDGRPGGVGSSKRLNLSCTSTNTPTVNIGGTASYCHLQYCSITGVNSVTTNTIAGTVHIGSATTGGADNDTVSHCEISSGASNAVCGIYVGGSVGTAVSDNCAVINCDVHDLTGVGGGMIWYNISSLNGAITGNNIYHTSTKTASGSIFCIYTQSAGHTISGNYIGGTQAYCRGSFMLYDGATSKIYHGIYETAGTSTISGNKICNIKIEGNGTLYGIRNSATNSSITNNTVGAETGIDSIVFDNNMGTSSAIIQSIVASASTVTGNKVGAIKTQNSSGTPTGAVIYGISVSGASTVNNNQIGSLTTANSIHQNIAVTGGSNYCAGILSTATTAIITNNTIANFTNSNTNTGSTFYGIRSLGATISGNIIRDNICAAPTTTSMGALCGIYISAGTPVVANNKVYGLKTTAATSAAMYGIYGGVGSGNLIYGLSSSATTATITGVYLSLASANFSNNMIRLGIDETGASQTAGHTIYGVYENTSLVNNIYHNSVYIGGTGVAGSANTSCFYTASNPTRSIQDNIFVNARANGSGTGKHYNIMLGTTITSLTLSHNLYNSASSFLGLYNSTDYTSLSNWQLGTSMDASAVYADPLFINATAGTASIDMHLDAGSPAEGAGTAIVAVTTDYDGETRSSLSPTDIGADADDFGIPWTGATSTDWNTASNWKDNTPPTTAQMAVIPSTAVRDPQVNSNNTVAGLKVNSGRTLTITSGNTLTVTGNLKNNATITGAGNLALAGSSAQAISGTGTVNNLTLNNSAGATIATDAQVNLTGTYTPTSGSLSTNGKLTLKSTSTYTARIAQGSGTYITGNVTVERYVPGGRRAYRFFGHPFTSAIALSQFSDDLAVTGTGGASNGFYTTHTNNASAYYYDPATGFAGAGNDPGWKAYTSAITTSWAQHQGMRLLVRGAGDEGIWVNSYTPSAVTIDWSGELNQGTQVISLTKGTNSGVNITGNPFASPVTMGVALSSASDIDGSSYWVWDPMQQGYSGKGAYVPYVIGNANVIPSGSAVVVKVTANTSVSVTEAHKADTPVVNAFRTTAISNMAELHVFDTTGAYYDRIYVRADAASATNKEQRDGEKFSNPNVNFYVWSADTQKLSLDTRPFVHNDVIPLGFTTTQKQPFVIEVMNSNYPAGTQLTLHDKYLNTVTPLDPGARYRFEVASDTLSQGDKRFELGVTVMPAPPVTGVKKVAKNQLQVNCVPNPATNYVDVSIMGSEVANTTVSVYDLSGSIVYRDMLGALKDRVARISLQELASGMYIVSVQHGTEVMTGRIVKQ
jgi:hypothetical protein